MLIDIKPRIVKPPFSSIQINQSHPLLTGSGIQKGLLVPFDVGGKPFETFQRNPIIITGSASIKFNTAGFAGNVASTSTLSYWTIGTEGSGLVLPTASVTVAVIRRKKDTTARAATIFGYDQTPGDTTRLGAHIPFSDGTVYWDFGGLAAPNRLTWTGYTIRTQVEKWVFVAGRQGSAIYFNGVQKASQTTAITRAVGTASFFLNNGNSATLDKVDVTDINFFLLVPKEWTAAQVASWTAAPYDFLTPVPGVRYWGQVPATGGTGVISTGGATLNTGPRSPVFARFP